MGIQIKNLLAVDEGFSFFTNLLLEDNVYIFRGFKFLEQLKPKLLRKPDFAKHEFEVLNEFQKYASITDQFRTPGDFYVLAQHYSVPTRLLDFTYNPFVALYFSINSEKENSNSNSILCLKIKNREKDFIDTFDFNDEFMQENLGVLDINPNILNCSYFIKDCIISEKKKVNQCLKLVKTTYTNERIFSQKGLFVIDFSENYFDQINHFANKFEGYIVHINPTIKDKLLDFLDKIGINQFSLMRDLNSAAELAMKKYNYM